jgi:hypothetical protein
METMFSLLSSLDVQWLRPRVETMVHRSPEYPAPIIACNFMMECRVFHIIESVAAVAVTGVRREPGGAALRVAGRLTCVLMSLNASLLA